MSPFMFFVGQPLQWRCKCGNELPDDRNFCVQCDRERPPGK